MAPLAPQAPGSIREFTVRAVVAGVILGVLFGAANAYTGLRIGMTICASIPAAVMTVAVFKLMRRPATILEANISQAGGSASTALATGTIFTIPALFMWGIPPGYFQLVALCFLGGVLGIAAMIPLRRLLIVEAKDELPYPEGTACADVLKTTVAGGTGAGWIFAGIAIGMAVKLAISLLHLFPGEIGFRLPVMPNAAVWFEILPISIAVGYILGPVQSGVIVSGSLVSWLVLIPMISHFGAAWTTPLFPETERLISAMDEYDIWGKYVRYVGAGAVALAGIVTLVRNLPGMARSLSAIAGGLRRSGLGAGEAGERTERDLPISVIVTAILGVIAVCAFVPGVFGGDMPQRERLILAIGVAVFGIMFVAVAARIVGLVGVTSQPTSGIALCTILGTAGVFWWLGHSGLAAQAAVLTVGTVVSIAASKAGDISQDLKTGHLVGATPALMQITQLIAAAVACWAVAATVLMLGKIGFGTAELPAPQATLMKTVVEGVLSGQLPWALVLMGVGLTLCAMALGVSGLAFAIGVYLPLSAMLPIFVGGMIYRLAHGRQLATGTAAKRESESSPGILAASGLVAGEAFAGLLAAVLVGTGIIARRDTLLGGGLGSLIGLGVTVAICAFLFAAGRRANAAER